MILSGFVEAVDFRSRIYVWAFWMQKDGISNNSRMRFDLPNSSCGANVRERLVDNHYTTN